MTAPYLSEIKFKGGPTLDFIEITVDAGTDVSSIQVIVYNTDGTIRTTNSLGTLVNTVAGQDVYVIDTATSGTFNGLHKNGAVALDDNGTVTSFQSFAASVTATEGPANGMTSNQLGDTAGGHSWETNDGGASYFLQTTPNSGTVPCFVEGTLILTPAGYRPIETLNAGDTIITSNNGSQTLRWIGNREIDIKSPNLGDFAPVLIPANAIAPGVPSTDLFVSPNHRIVVKHAQCNLLFGQSEVLVSAKSLIGHNGIGRLGVSYGFRYFHMLFDQHEVITSNGLATESFHPGHVGLGAFAAGAREEVLTLFPELRISENIYGPTARMALQSFEADVLCGAAFGQHSSAAISCAS